MRKEIEVVESVLSEVEGFTQKVLPEGRGLAEIEVRDVQVEVRDEKILQLRKKAFRIMDSLLDKAVEWEKLDRTDKMSVVAVIRMLFPLMGGGEGREEGYEELVHRVRKQIR